MSRRIVAGGGLLVVLVGSCAWLFGQPTIAQSNATAPPGAFAPPPGFEGFLGPQSRQRSRGGETLIQSGNGSESPTYYVLVSPDKRRLWACSTAKAEWVRAPLSDGGVLGEPILGTAVATVSDGKMLHAFSSLTGTWQSLKLPEAEAVPTVGADYAELRTNRTVSIFSARRGEWATVKFAEE